MNIVNDLSKLPTAGKVEGHPPDTTALKFMLPITDAWLEIYLESGADSLEFAIEGSRFRGSWAAKCARAMGYEILHRDAEMNLAKIEAMKDTAKGMGRKLLLQAQAELARWEPTEPMTITNYWTFALGTHVHEDVQRAMERAYPGVEIEIKVTLEPDINGGSTVDARLTFDKKQAEAWSLPLRPGKDTYVICWELKSINGFGFKNSASGFKGAPQGPRHSAVVQGALAATASDADLLIVSYWSLEQIGPDLVKLVEWSEIGRFSAGWSFTPEQFRPIAEREHKRVNKIIEIVDGGHLPPRAIDDPEIPAGARIVDPMKGSKGMWTVVDKATDTISQTGQTWHCAYCNHRSHCNADGAGTPVIVRT